MEDNTFLLFLSFLFLTFGNGFSHGFYHPLSFACVLLSLLFLIIHIHLKSSGKKIPFWTPNNETMLRFTFIFCLFFSWLWYGGLYQNRLFGYYFSSLFLFGIFLIYFILFVVFRQKKISQALFWSTIIVAFILRIIMIQASPSPKIDVFDTLKFGTNYLLHGINPYSASYPSLYQGVKSDYFAYFPGVIYLFLPLKLFFQDPRVTTIVFDLIAVIFFLKTQSGVFNNIFILIYLFSPLSLYLLEESYFDNIIFLLLALSLYFLRNGKYIFSALIFGFALSTKQYVIIAFPIYFTILLNQKGKYTKDIIMSVAFIIISLLIVNIPFLLWNSKDYLKDTVEFVLFQQAARYDSLSIASYLYRDFSQKFSYVLFFLSNIFVIVFATILCRLKKISATESLIAIFFIFFLFNRQAFANYYHLVSLLMLLSISEAACRQNF